MQDADIAQIFSNTRSFEWDEKKRSKNLKKHGIDFDDARAIFDGPMLVKQSNHNAEKRYVVVGFVEEVEVTVICTLRTDRCRIISARRARTNERKELHRRLQSGDETG